MEDSKYGKHGEEAALYGAYKKSLELCKENDLHSVVFPLISAGIFGYPLQGAWIQAAATALTAILVDENKDFVFELVDQHTQNKMKNNSAMSREVTKGD